MDKQQAAREAFEKWARASMKAGETNGLARKESGEYLWSGTSLCWDVWQAARSTLMPALVEARDALGRASKCQFQRYYQRNDGSSYLAGDDDAEYAVRLAIASIDNILGSYK